MGDDDDYEMVENDHDVEENGLGMHAESAMEEEEMDAAGQQDEDIVGKFVA